MELFFTRQAKQWEETLPIGNGSLGAMIWGGIQEEKIGLNQDSLWSGYEHEKNNPNAIHYLQQVRELVLSGKNVEAEKVIREHMLGEYNESYLPLGNLSLKFSHNMEVINYRRSLDLDQAIARVSYMVGEDLYTREYFSSYPSDAIFIKLTCSKPVMNVEIAFSSLLKNTVRLFEDMLQIDGKCPEHVDPNYVYNRNPIIQGEKGKNFQGKIQIHHTNGSIANEKEKLILHNASLIVLSISAVREANIDRNMEYEQLKQLHIEDYQKIYNKVELDLGKQKELPIDERLERLRKGEEDNGLFALYFQYGRYLLISSSRKGSLPANLQGIWSWELQAPWSSNFTTNINIQMNYWLAQSCNLQECMEPYFTFLQKICKNGQQTAKIHYNCRGFVHHHNADYWCSTNPVGIAHGKDCGEGVCATWSLWPMGGAWLTCELYKHYEYNCDIDFLRNTAYPILREAALFLIDWTFEYKGEYITCPSTSPENRFQTRDGDTSCIASSTAMDLELIREVFINFKRVCDVLRISDEIMPDIDIRLEKLTPLKIGSKGQLLEWNEEFKENELGHRHMSHLYGLFPSELFNGDERLIEACKKSLEIRLENGGGHTGWSCAWVINLFAILQDSQKAYQYLHTLLTKATHNNLWGDHPPFQIDANFGGAAGIANMLVQDRNGQVKLLPALPQEFKTGYVKGLRIKNGKTVNIRWENGEVIDYQIY